MTYSEYLKLLKDSIKEVKPIKYVLNGTVDRLSEAVKSDIKYPACWFSLPDLIDEDFNTSVNETWSFSIAIFENCEAGDFVKLDQIHQNTLEHLRKVLTTLKNKCNDSGHQIGDKVSYNILFPKTADNIQGWQAEVEILSSRNSC